MGLVAQAQLWTEKVKTLETRAGRGWPDSERCLAGARLNRAEDAPDVSRADYFFARLSAQRGHSAEEIASRLME